MDLSFSSLGTTLLISIFGMALFLYGKNAQRPLPLIAGLAMGIYPYFISNLVVLWALTGSLLAALYFSRQQ